MQVKIGNIFESKCNALVNTVNCVGVMGKGIALEFKKRYPDMFMDYVLKCECGQVKPGAPYVYQNADGTIIINFPTKDHWRSPSRLSYVEDGLNWFADNYEKYHIESIAFPPLGCGNGGLTWDMVGPVMYQKLSALPIRIEIYAPFGTAQKQLSKDFLTGKQITGETVGSPGLRVNKKWYLILQIIRELNNRRYSLKVGRTIYQKICFVLTRNGVDTGFTFSKGTYGPFSPQVKESIEALANANLIEEKQLGRMLSLSVADDVKIERESFTVHEWNAMKKTVDLFGRIKSTAQAEMIATVLYSYDQLVKDKTEVSDKEVYDYVLDWKPRWREKKEFELCDSIHNMAMLSLMNVTFSYKLMDTEAELFSD
ncbi:MAG: macro domain-containing protein [Lachnospiraceae bacterium]|nr:macro domain-containing protein [Lachnospiraceae bacterium]MCD7765073.1 macro domain-containing protein [Lachnospiraceae bacterium]